MNGHRSSEAAQNRQDPETNRPSLLPSIVCDGPALWQRRPHVTADYRRLEARHPRRSPTSAPGAAPAQARIGQEAVAPPLSTTSALLDRPDGQRHKSTRHQSIGQRGFAVNREVSVQGRSWLIRRRGGFTMSSVAWVTLTVPVYLTTTRFVAPCRWPALASTTAAFKSSFVDSRWGRGALRRGSGAGVVGVTPPPTQEPGWCLGVSGRRSTRIEYLTTLVRG
jgi:hypothetical protein